jgi:uncharacterized cupin superfamily protein
MRAAFIIATVGLTITTLSIAQDAQAPSPGVAIVELKQEPLSGAKFSLVKPESFMTSAANAPIQAAGVEEFVSSDKRLSAGYSKYKKVTLKLTNWPVDEVMLLLKGEVEITDNAGHSHVFRQGDAFVMPKGFSGTWRQLGDIEKMQVAYSVK